MSTKKKVETEQIIKDIRKLFGDDSISYKETREALEVIMEECDSLLEGMENDGVENEEGDDDEDDDYEDDDDDLDDSFDEDDDDWIEEDEDEEDE